MAETPEPRLATPADLPAITAIYNQAVALKSATADTEPVSIDKRRAWLKQHPPDRYPVFVAERDGAVVGWCSLSAYRPCRMALRHTAEISYYIDERWGHLPRVADFDGRECGHLYYGLRISP